MTVLLLLFSAAGTFTALADPGCTEVEAFWVWSSPGWDDYCTPDYYQPSPDCEMCTCTRGATPTARGDVCDGVVGPDPATATADVATGDTAATPPRECV